MNNYQLINGVGVNIHNLNLKVTYYARVSTESDVQINSLDNQVSYYETYIKKNKNWKLINGYIDEGKSGVTVNKRKAFLKMIEDASLKKFDLIITKEVSRFARDLEDSIHYIRLLKEYGVCIYFENQNLSTYDSNSELILNLMFNLAQEESQKLSKRIKFGHKVSMNKGNVLGPSLIGYYKDNCKLKINPDEALFVKRVFELYNEDKYGLMTLSRKLYSEGYRNKNGNMYDKDTLKRIITNPKYKGYYKGHIYETVDYRTKKRIKIPIDEQLIYKVDKNIIPPIITEELWNKANNIYIKRAKKYNLKTNYTCAVKYKFSSKIVCNDHNKMFQKSGPKEKPIWVCSNYIKYGVKSCLTPILYESDLDKIFKIIISKLVDFKNIYLNLQSYYDIPYQDDILVDIKCRIKNLQSKKQKIIELYSNEIINLDESKTEIKKINKEIEKLNAEKEQTKNEKKVNQYNTMNELEKINVEAFEEKFIRMFLEHIKVDKIDNSRRNIKLSIYLNLNGINIKNNNKYKEYNFFKYKSNINKYLIELYTK